MDMEASTKEHLEILDTYRRRDRQKAVELIRSHLRNAADE
jgi:DNA-binding GntR family transcriptional regulator